MAIAAKAERIDVKEATRLAMEYFHKLYGNLKDVALEEVEESEDGKYWQITLGYNTESKLLPKGGQLEVLFALRNLRKYKTFKINAETGRIVSMKIRKVD